MIIAVLSEYMGELMECRTLMKDPRYKKLYAKLYGKELGQLSQGLQQKVTGTNIIFFHP